jgi:hypothetical protein
MGLKSTITFFPGIYTESTRVGAQSTPHRGLACPSSAYINYNYMAVGLRLGDRLVQEIYDTGR